MKTVPLIFLLVGSFALVSCLYDPEPYTQTTTPTESTETDFGTVYAVNSGRQICNPSVSQDSKNYPASMLWLNFSGNLTVSSAPRRQEPFSMTGSRFLIRRARCSGL